MKTIFSIRRSGPLALMMAIASCLTTSSIYASGGRHVSPSDLPPARHRAYEEPPDVNYGRAMIYRTGEASRPVRPRANAKQKKSQAPVRALHFFDTTLPIIIQGMPARLEMSQARTAC